VLGKALQAVLRELNQRGECQLPLDDANLLSLKLPPAIQEPPLVEDCSYSFNSFFSALSSCGCPLPPPSMYAKRQPLV
jgi:hypothetical protein